jgi:hypothetical protein
VTNPRSGPPTGPHATDGVLLALIDEEHDDEGRAELADAIEHVSGCNVCQERMSAIEASSRRVREALAAIIIPVSGESTLHRGVTRTASRIVVPVWRRPAWQAAVACLVLAAAAAASPIRHWLLRRFNAPTTPVSLEPASAPSAAAQSTTPRMDRSSIVSFAPSGADFTVQFDSLSAAGVLTAERSTAPEISARALNGASADPLMLLPGILRVRSTPVSHASYVISLPTTVKRLRVIVAGTTMFDGAPPATIRLDRRR